MLIITNPGSGVVRTSSRQASRYSFRSSFLSSCRYSARFPAGFSARFSARFLGLAAAALLIVSAATSERAQAVSLINPGAAATAKVVADGLTTQVRGGHSGGGHGGGGGHGWGGGVRGGAAIHSGAFRTGPVFRGSGVRSGVRFGGHRFGHRHHRRFFAGGYYDDYPYYAYPGCAPS